MSLKAYQLAGPNPCPMTIAEVDALAEIAKKLPPWPVIINIGADVGCSTLTLLETCPDATIFSIDVRPCEAEKRNISLAGLPESQVIRILGKSESTGFLWENVCKVNLVFVDGDHSKEGVLAVIRAWWDHIKKGGYLVFHDYIPEPIPPEILGRVVYAVDDNPILEQNFKEVLWVERLKAFQKK